MFIVDIENIQYEYDTVDEALVAVDIYMALGCIYLGTEGNIFYLKEKNECLH